MTVLGILMAVVGIAGAVLTFMGLVQRTDIAGNPTAWAILAVVGVVLFFLTRRPND